MKILYHHRTVSKDGMDVHITEMIKAFRALGHDVVLVAPSMGAQEFGGGGGWVDTIRARLPRFAGELLELGYNVAAYRNLSRAIREEKPDAIYERYALFLLAGIWAKRRFGRPLVLEVNSPLFAERRDHGGLSLQSLSRWCEAWVWKSADACLPVTAVLAGHLTQAGVPDRNITVIPNGIDPAEFSTKADGAPIRNRYQLGSKIVLGFTGFVRPWHGLDRILHAIAELGATADVHLLVVGDGPARADLERLARDLNIADRLTFTGVVQRAQMAQHIAAFDVALQPDATPYASPLKLVEYMAMGKAILAIDQPNIRELLTADISGLLFSAGHPDAMRTALHRLILSPELRTELGNGAALEVTRRPLTWLSNAQRVVAILEVLNAKRSAR